MMLAKVIGSVVCTAKNVALEGKKLLLIQPVTKDGKPRGRALVAVDAIGAGFRETIYWCRGREAALAFEPDVPTDATIVGIVDQITSRVETRVPPPSSAPPASPNPKAKPKSHRKQPTTEN